MHDYLAMIRRVENGWQIASYAAQNAPEQAVGYRLEFFNPQGHTAHLPASGAFTLNPVTLPVGVPIAKLHLIYIGHSGEAIPGPANLAALDMVISGQEESAERAKNLVDEDSQTPLEIAEETQVRQDLARTDLELLTINRLQGFLGTALEQFKRLQEASVKSAEAQVEMSLKNLEKIMAQGSKMLEAQYESAKFFKDHLANLKPPEPPPPPTDMGAVVMGIAEVVRDCLVTFQGGAPALAALPGLRPLDSRGRTATMTDSGGASTEIKDAEPVASDPVKQAAGYILKVAEEKQLRQLSDPKRFEEFVEGFRKLMLPASTGASPSETKPSEATSGTPRGTRAAPNAKRPDSKPATPTGEPMAKQPAKARRSRAKSSDSQAPKKEEA